MYIIIVELDVLSGSNKKLCWSILTDRDIVVYLSVQFFPATETWKHDRRRGHHWATSDWSAISPVVHSEPRNLKSGSLSQLSSDSFVRQKPKLNIPSEVFRRQKRDTQLQMWAGAGLNMTHYWGNRTKYCGNGGPQDWKIGPVQTSIGNIWIEINQETFTKSIEMTLGPPKFILFLPFIVTTATTLSWVDTLNLTLQLTTLGKNPLHDTGCWRQWLKESSYCCIPVVEHLVSV